MVHPELTDLVLLENKDLQVREALQEHQGSRCSLITLEHRGAQAHQAQRVCTAQRVCKETPDHRATQDLSEPLGVWVKPGRLGAVVVQDRKVRQVCMDQRVCKETPETLDVQEASGKPA